MISSSRGSVEAPPRFWEQEYGLGAREELPRRRRVAKTRARDGLDLWVSDGETLREHRDDTRRHERRILHTRLGSLRVGDEDDWE